MGCVGSMLGCSCGDYDKKGITKISTDRTCTDIPMVVLFLAFWGAVLAIMSVSIQAGGDPRKIVYGLDYNGKVCGVDLPNQPFIAWPYLQKAPEVRICLASCNETLTSTRFVRLNNYESEQYLKFCLPKAALSVAASAINGTSAFPIPAEFSGVASTASRAFGDLYTAYGVIAGSCGIAIVASFLYLVIVQRAAGVLVWVSLLLILVGGIFTSAQLLAKAREAENSSDSTRASAMKGLGITCVVLTFLYFCIMVWMRNRINVAVEVTKEASKALQDMPAMLLFPIVPFFFCVAYFIWWIYTTTIIFSVQIETVKPNPEWNLLQPKPNDWPEFAIANSTAKGYKAYGWDESLKKSFVIHFFHMLWNVQFFVFLTFLSLAGAVAHWYFTPYNAEGKKPRGDGENELPNSVVRQSFFRTIRYHVGSVLFAALIIAIIQFIRACLIYAERKAKESGMNETLRKIIFCCLHCFMKCVECCMNQINRNGLVFVAVYGMPFCPATCAAFKMAWNNLARIAWITIVGNFLLGIGNVLICLLTTGICAMILFSDTYAQNLSSPALPLVIIFLIAYCIGNVFMTVLETCIDTVFMCFLIDEENNKASGRYLASESLKKMIDGYSAESEKEAKARKGDANPPSQA